MLALIVKCCADNTRLTYNSTTRTTFNAQGGETRIPGLGSTTTSVEWIDKSMQGFSTYCHFSLIVSKFLPFGENIHEAPYDFRRAAIELTDYFLRVKALVETTYAKMESEKKNFTRANHVEYFFEMGAPNMEEMVIIIVIIITEARNRIET